ncbi:HAMP domain-containing histidine kinase [Pyxidicoccus parkwayensis]|uniref:histidine kinase n=1 Tax=Pyxidicoccus parkwayensis TaxID=2813578 RepID=A0ABX7NR52_9BACT|nr:HAMP domain-containing sensor histidine kinase [Pyxidicoccus parkwaysis]QSQ21183.1 HAMP domain-containing histidine kinase [Pyxidicoccus parkwaysis]
MSGYSFRRPGRLLLRIYLVGLTQLVLVSGVLYLARSLVLERPFKHGFVRNVQYNVSEWAQLRNDPEALQESLDRAARFLDAEVTVRDASGRLIATNMSQPTPPLNPDKVASLTWPAPGQGPGPRPGAPPPGPFPVLTLPIPEQGPVEGYVSISMRPPGPPAENTTFIVAAVLVCTAITSLVFARTLAGPLQRLAQVARDFGAGKLDTRTGFRRRDELGEVAEAFDEMAGRITHLLRSQKELLANVSHELRTPLSRIRVALDLAAEGDADTAREMLTDITEDLSELERLVDDVLTAAKLDLSSEGSTAGAPPLRNERVDARALVDKAAGRFRTSRPTHTLVVSVDEHLPALDADPVLLRRVLDNLLDNAGKYSEPRTTVHLHARATGQGLQFEVVDQGIGIEAADLPRVGTPFFRTDRSRARKTGGVGLGLTLARRIVDAHGGTLTLESRPGEGTTARITLPAAPTGGQAESVSASVHA